MQLKLVKVKLKYVKYINVHKSTRVCVNVNSMNFNLTPFS